MANMPTKSFLTSGSTTEAEFQSGIGDFYDVVNQLGILGTPEELAITTGIITPTKCDIVVDTESLAALDTLDLIVPTNIGEKLLFIKCKNASRPVTITHLASGTGKIFLTTEANTILNNPKYVIALKWNAANAQWVEYWRNFGIFVPAGEEATVRASLGLGTASTRNTGILTGQIPLKENFGSAAFVNTGISSGQVPLANQLGTLAFLSSVTDAQLSATGVTPGAYTQLTVNAQGRVTGGTLGGQEPIRRIYSTIGTTTWNKPAGLKMLEVIVIGGGSSGNYAGFVSGNDGSTSSFGTHCSATGGIAPNIFLSAIGTPGYGIGGDWNLQGALAVSGSSGSTIQRAGGKPPNLPLFLEFPPPTVPSGITAGVEPGGGGSSLSNDVNGGGAPGGLSYKRLFTSELASTVTITVGFGGAGNASYFGAGAKGRVIVIEHY